jgi:hypothetical protein
MITTQIHFLNAENKNPPQTTTIEREPVELIPANKFFQNCKNALALNQQKQQPPHCVASYSVSHLRCDWRHLKLPPNKPAAVLKPKMVGCPDLNRGSVART